MLPFFRQTFPISRSLPLHTFRTLGIFRPQSTVSTSYSTTIPPISSVTNAPLAPLPTTSLLRSLLLHSITSSPRTLKLGTKVMLANLETIDRNFLLKWGVDKTFYAQFCAGSNSSEIKSTVSNLRSLGYKGVILAYAREAEITDLASTGSQSQQIREWLEGTLKTIAYTNSGDYVAIKYSGAGASSLPLLKECRKCFDQPELGAALIKICEAAKEKGIRLLVDAEQAAIQDGVHGWSLQLMRRFNTKDQAVVYNTYQMYLKSSPEVLCRHLEVARREDFTLGVKLVRGAYLGSDPRHLIYETKEDTDKAYNEAIRLMLTGSPCSSPMWNLPAANSSTTNSVTFFDTPVRPLLTGKKVKVDLVVASHNKESVDKVLTLRRSMTAEECGVGELVFAQLMGMADELSLGLVVDGSRKIRDDDFEMKVYKYAVWGSTQECVRYLLRRAEENKDAVARSSENRKAVMEEVWRRIRGESSPRS